MIVERLRFALLVPVLILGGSCGGSHRDPLLVNEVSVDVIVTDAFGVAYEGVQVQLLEAWNEWSGVRRPGVGALSSLESDRTGVARIGPVRISASGLGFLEAPAGVAVLSSDLAEDEALLTLRIGDPLLGWIEVDVPLSFDEPHVEVLVEF